MIVRGIKTRFLGLLSSIVCDCKCHEPGTNIRHVRACCGPPKNPVEKAIIDAYFGPQLSHEELEAKMLELEKEIENM
jgi:hypothetical protein